MSEDPADNPRSIRRRNVLQSAGVLGAGHFLSSTATATQSAQSGTQINQQEIDTSDWEVTIESIDEPRKATEANKEGVDTNTINTTEKAETYVYIGPNKNTETGVVPAQSDDVSINSFGGTISVVTFDIPNEVPIVGGKEASIDVTAELGLSGVDAGINLCIGGRCVSIGGFSLDLFTADLIRIEVKGTIYGVPFEVEGAISASAGRDGLVPQLELGGSVQLCLGRDLCDDEDDDEEDGWDRVTCQLCKDASVSGSLP